MRLMPSRLLALRLCAILLASSLLTEWPDLAVAAGDPAPVVAAPAALPVAPRAGEESVGQALCRLIETSAAKASIPVPFFTRLIWQESSFRAGAVSPAGAQGIAQFMPGTARERGLSDPFDPEQAIPASAALLADLVQRFGNIGLAAAAYNGGPARASAWLSGKGGLPFETQDYVQRITGRSAEDWAADLKGHAPPPLQPTPSCQQIVADLRLTTSTRLVAEAPFAPWGVQLAGNFSKARALASFERARSRYETIIADTRPMIIGTRLRTRGTRAFYRVRVPADSRAAANDLCSKIHAAHGACIVLRS
ncbi:lytic transglycosylase domain-containing protein [Lichenihabitans psoromatis]|uniref:lytic transglycosylase domain-containing protein n=1 Tax=Lichenihabitans psoromatis TaxID=2528642 RepID=UPI0010384ED7|nr:lytic transglycosylase domain-containing protein [Lichenihabitans psoromatis]